MSAPRPAPLPGDSPGGTDVVPRIEAAAGAVTGISDGPLDEALASLEALHRELQGALADLDRA